MDASEPEARVMSAVALQVAGTTLARRVAGQLFAIAAIVVCAAGHRAEAQQPASSARLITLGGSVTETVFALGAGDRVVAVDASSLYPTEARALPQVGYFRTLSAEGVLSLEPDLILASEGAGPPPVVEQLEASGVRIVWVTDEQGPDAALEKIEVLSEALGIEERGRALAEEVRADLRTAAELRETTTSRPSALFVWGHGSGGLTVGGDDTGAALMLGLAGAENAAVGISGYQPMTGEAILLASPEVLVVPRNTLEGLGGLDALLAAPGVSSTPAGRARRVVVVDLLGFIGFGPRVGEALLNLVRDLHPELGGASR